MPFHSKVAGTTHKNKDGVSRQFLIAHYCRPGMKLILKPEPNNIYDHHAIGVWAKTKVWFFFEAEFQIGYIGEHLSEELSDHLESGGRIEVQISNVTGGTEGKHYGLNILIDKKASIREPQNQNLAVGREDDRTIRDDSVSFHRDIQIAVRRLRFIQLRQSTRKALDLMRLRSGLGERLCAALILSSVFFLGFLGMSRLVGLSTLYGLLLALMPLLVVLSSCVGLVLWPSDDALEKERNRVMAELAELHQAEVIQGSVDDPVKELSTIETPSRSPQSKSKQSKTQKCPFCAEVILAAAVKCKHCGEFLEEDLREQRSHVHDEYPRSPRWSPGVAAVLSLVIPGAGQMYKGQVLNGLAWLFLVAVGYLLCLVPGIFLHLFCILGAASGTAD